MGIAKRQLFAAQQLANIDGCGAPNVYDISSEDEESGKEDQKNQSATLPQRGRSHHHNPIFVSRPDHQCKILKEKVMTVGNSKSPIRLSSDVDDGAVEGKIRVRLDFLATQKTGANPKPVQIRLQALASRPPAAFMVAIREKKALSLGLAKDNNPTFSELVQVHSQGHTGGTMCFRKQDFVALVELGQFLTDGAIYFYSGLLLERDLLLVRLAQSSPRSWIYSPHFMTILRREKEMATGFCYDKRIACLGSQWVPG